jgi:hypothetical protein
MTQIYLLMETNTDLPKFVFAEVKLDCPISRESKKASFPLRVNAPSARDPFHLIVALIKCDLGESSEPALHPPRHDSAGRLKCPSLRSG